jgi:hypothetical protein
VKLTESYDQAISLAQAVPTTTSGLGQWGWLTIRLSAVDVELVATGSRSYRNIAPKKLVAEPRRRAARDDELRIALFEKSRVRTRRPIGGRVIR